MESQKRLIDKYKEKENYMNTQPMEWWEGHLDKVLIEEYASYMGKIVLDIGCNTGGLTTIMSKMFKEVVGVDINKEAIDNAKATFNKMENLSFVSTIARDLSMMPNEYFDGVFCLQTLEHLFKDDVEPTLKEIRRIMKLHGYMLAILPRAGDEQDRRYKIRAYDPVHESFLYTEDDVRKLFGGIFKITSIKHETRGNPKRTWEKHNSWVVLLHKEKQK